MVGVRSVNTEVLVIREGMERLDYTSIIGRERSCLMRDTLVKRVSIHQSEM